MDTPQGDRHGIRAVPRGVWALGFVSLLMDLSSEMVHALLPLYLVTVLGASMLAVGVIEGVAEAAASVTRIFSGALSDRIGRRKMLAVAGYGLSACTRPVFPLAGAVGWFVLARLVDRIGKGIRGAPRDALIADLTPEHARGAGYGLRQSLDTVGAVLGPLLAILLMALTAGSFTTVLWVAVLPAFLAAGLLIVAVEEPPRSPQLHAVAAPLSLGELGRLGGAFWLAVGVAGLFTLARFSEAFLILRAQSVGVSVALAPAVLVVMNVLYTLAAYPAGRLSDRIGRWPVLVAGILLLIAADLVLAFAAGPRGLAAGVALWGLHMGFTQGLFAALVADAAPTELRGTAFGMFHLATGIALLAASIIAGVLWDTAGPAGTFLAGAAFTTLTLLGVLALRGRLAGSAA